MLCLSCFGAGALRCHGAATAFCAEQSVDFLCGGAAVERAVFAARANIAQTVTFIAEQHSREFIVRAKRFCNRFACVKIDRQVCRNEILLCFGMQLFAVQFCKLRVFLAELLVQALHLFFLAGERVEHAVRLYGKRSSAFSFVKCSSASTPQANVMRQPDLYRICSKTLIRPTGAVLMKCVPQQVHISV